MVLKTEFLKCRKNRSYLRSKLLGNSPCICNEVDGSKGAQPARTPKGPDSFILTYKFLEMWVYWELDRPVGNPGSATEWIWCLTMLWGWSKAYS